MARQGLRNSRGRGQTFPQNPQPTRGCPSVSTQCSPISRHRRAQRLQRGERAGQCHPSASQGRRVLQDTHTWHTVGLLPLGSHWFCSPHCHLSPVLIWLSCHVRANKQPGQFTQYSGVDTAFLCSKNQSFCARNKGLGIEKKNH